MQIPFRNRTKRPDSPQGKSPSRSPTVDGLIGSDVDATQNTRLPVPSTNPATNLVIADIVVRGVSGLLRRKVENRVAKANYGDDARAKEVLDGRTIITTVMLYGVSRLATRSPLGLGVVASVLLGKTLYDRGKARQNRTRLAGREARGAQIALPPPKK